MPPVESYSPVTLFWEVGFTKAKFYLKQERPLESVWLLRQLLLHRGHGGVCELKDG